MEDLAYAAYCNTYLLIIRQHCCTSSDLHSLHASRKTTGVNNSKQLQPDSHDDLVRQSCCRLPIMAHHNHTALSVSVEYIRHAE